MCGGVYVGKDVGVSGRGGYELVCDPRWQFSWGIFY